MNQSRIDSIMETVTNTAIGLIISTLANWLLLDLYLGYPMHLGSNALISAVFTVISIIRSYTLRRAFNGRSVWSAIKDKFNARISAQAGPDAGLVSPGPRAGAPGVSHVRLGSDVTPRHRKRSYHHWGIREQAAH